MGVWDIAFVQVEIIEPGVVFLNVMGQSPDGEMKMLARKKVKVDIGEGLKIEDKNLIRKLEIDD